MPLQLSKPTPFQPSLSRELSSSELKVSTQTNRAQEIAELGAQKGEKLLPVSLEVKTTGKTHTVGIDDKGSLFDGKELKTIHAGETIKIDPNNGMRSRRGPHQESDLNHYRDFKSAENYVWYPEYSEGQDKLSDYKREGWPYIRSDAIAEDMLPSYSSQNLRGRAAPTENYKKIEGMSAGEYISHQKKYQEELKGFEPKEIMTSHRSVGLEYEFVGHSKDRMDSHISLAKSEEHSKLFGIKFELETDSGPVVEIGMPPFIVPNKADGSPDRIELQNIHIKMRDVMREVKDEALSKLNKGEVVKLKDIVEILKQKGLGEKWEIAVTEKHKNDIDSLEVRDLKLKKFEGSGVYSQMNISLSGDESGKLITSAGAFFEGREMAAEKSAMGTVQRRVNAKAAELFFNGKRDELPPHFVHLGKALANTLAIPSIMLQEEIHPMSEDNLSSTVKELDSVWVKDSLPNILKSTLAFDEELTELKEFAKGDAKKILTEELDNLLEGLKEDEEKYHYRSQEYKAWKVFSEKYGKKDFYFDNGDLKDLVGQENKLITDHIDFEKILEEAKKIDKMMDGSDLIDKEKWDELRVEYEEDYEALSEEGSVDDDPMQREYENRNAKFKRLVNATFNGLGREQGFEHIRKTVLKEVDNMIDKIDSKEIVFVSKTAFQGEGFGEPTSIGVRKDTYVPRNQGDVEGIDTSVVEIRNEAAMNHFFDPAAKPKQVPKQE